MTDHRDRTNRDRNGKFVKTLDSAERDREACRLRAQGWTHQAIADHCGYGNEANARRAIRAALEAIQVEGANELRTLMSNQLDYLTIEALRILETDHPVVTHSGRIVVDQDGRPLVDDGPKLQAIDRLLRIQERRARLLGLDLKNVPPAPLDMDEVDREIERLMEIVGRDEGNEQTETTP